MTDPEVSQHERVRELEARIAEFESLDESAFGEFTRWDWTACVLLALVVPAMALWWFAA